MTYIEGFVTAVPTANKDAYTAHAEKAADMILSYGATRMAEAWGDDVPHGERTDFHRAVQARDDETVVFSWFEYPDRAARDAANERMIADPRMEEMATDVPFDGSRMIYGGFQTVLDTGGGRGAYIDGFVAPVRSDRRDAYVAVAQSTASVFLEHGAVRVVENLGDDVPTGKVTDYARAVAGEADEIVAYSWIEWPDKPTRDAGWQKIMGDPRMTPEGGMPFDMGRLLHAGFVPVLDRSGGAAA